MLCAAMFTLQRIEREIERLQQTDEISPIFLNEDSHFPPPVGQCVSWHKVKRKRRQLRNQKDYPTIKKHNAVAETDIVDRVSDVW